VLRIIRDAVPPGACAWSPPVRSSRVLLCPFEGLTVGGERELTSHCRGMTTACPHRVVWYLHSVRDGCTVTGFGRTVTGSDAEPQAMSAARFWGDLPFDYGACSGSEHLMPLSGGMSRAPPVEGWPRARWRFARGALVPRARRRLA
jgi:hypothetical protein